MIPKIEIEKALDTLRSGGVFLYPTDTVWGIGCDATDEEAVRRVFSLKRRDDSKSLVMLARDMDMIQQYVESIPEMARQLVEVNDAPMTIIYPGAIIRREGSRLPGLAPSTVAADGTAGIRIPVASEFCMTLLKAFGKPIVSTSANISGEPTPRSFSEISDVVCSAVDFVVDASCEDSASGRASQIIKLGLDGTVKVIRA